MAVITTAIGLLARGGDWGSGSWWPVFPLFWVVVVGVVMFAIFRFRRGPRWHHGHTAEDVLAERYARGEISVEEYRERLSVLKESAS